MKSWKFVAGAVLVLAGFCAGAGLNIFKVNSTVYGATSDPNSALKSVAHDGTLAGDGTTSAPLGIANGGVSAPKLSASAPPSVGQILGFNGSNLAWQNAPIGGVRVVDSQEQVVGQWAQEGALAGAADVLRKVGDFNFLLLVGGTGFEGLSGSFFSDHATSDCSGPRYYREDDTGLFRGSFNNSTELIYAAEPLQQITVRSMEAIPIANPSQSGTCQVVNQPFVASEGPLTTANLSTLNLTPPFHLEF